MCDVLVKYPFWPDDLYLEDIDEIHISDRLKRITFSDHVHPDFSMSLELTVENVRKMSRFHPRCGTAFMFVMLIISMFLSFSLVVIFPELQTINKMLWIMIKIAILPLVMGIGYEFIKFAGKHDNFIVSILSYPGLLMQRITTVEPTDDIIEVAIESMKAVLTDNPEDDKI